jgi:hypothetical protein
VNLDKSYTSFMDIESGCQVDGCRRRSRVCVVVCQATSRANCDPDIALSFVCNKHAKAIAARRRTAEGA